jgi:hypothetical protein
MDVPTAKVGYTAAMHRKEDHEIHKDMWWHGGRNKNPLKSSIVSKVSTYKPVQALRAPGG